MRFASIQCSVNATAAGGAYSAPPHRLAGFRGGEGVKEREGKGRKVGTGPPIGWPALKEVISVTNISAVAIYSLGSFLYVVKIRHFLLLLHSEHLTWKHTDCRPPLRYLGRKTLLVQYCLKISSTSQNNLA